MQKKYVGTNKDRENVTPWSAMSIFRFSSVIDKLLITLGISASIGNGICVPFLTIYLANITSSLINGGLSDSEVYDIICSNNTYYEGSRYVRLSNYYLSYSSRTLVVLGRIITVKW